MKKSSILFLKGVLLLIALGVFVGLIRFPQTEGRAAHLDLASIYLNPFIIYIYLGSIPFFVGLFQAFKLLHLIDANKVFSQNAIKALKTIRVAALSQIGFIVLALVYIRLTVQGDDDPAGPAALGMMVSISLLAIAAAATVFQKILQSGTRKA